MQPTALLDPIPSTWSQPLGEEEQEEEPSVARRHLDKVCSNHLRRLDNAAAEQGAPMAKYLAIVRRGQRGAKGSKVTAASPALRRRLHKSKERQLVSMASWNGFIVSTADDKLSLATRSGRELRHPQDNRTYPPECFTRWKKEMDMISASFDLSGTTQTQCSPSVQSL